MGKVILNLLCPLYISEFKAYFRDTVCVVFQFRLLILLELLDFQTHIATHSTYLIIFLHILVHLEKGKAVRFETDI